MNKALVNSLTEAEFLLISETEPKALAVLDEDELVELHTRIRRARTKYVKLYRRGASARVSEQGGRGKARPKNSRNAAKAEAFEDALARVSKALAAAARQSAAELKAERIAAARGEKKGSAAKKGAATSPRARKTSQTNKRVGDRAHKSAVSKKRAGSVGASGARRQAKRDSR